MKQTLTLVAALVITTGCNKIAKVDNPVAPEPPPRLSFDNRPTRDTSKSAPQLAARDEKPLANVADEIPAYDDLQLNEKGVTRVTNSRIGDASTNADRDLGTATGTLVLVNGEPIFAEDVLLEFERRVAKTKQRMTAAQIEEAQPELRAARAEFLRRSLPMHVQSKLLSSALLKSLTEEQKELLDQGMKQAFEDSLEKKKKELGITSRGELEVAMAKEGVTMQRMQQAFYENQMAQLYVSQNAGTPPKFSRRELFDYYQEHKEEYAVEGKVKWRQIKIGFKERGGEPVARQDIAKIEQLLINGADFSELAEEHSDGPTALNGGMWDWTEMGSLVDENLEAILFQIRPGTVSDVIKSDDSYHIVQVVERIDPGYVPFEDVHEKIKLELRQSQYQEAAAKLVDELKKTAVIEPKYDFGDTALLQ
ncbi:peptidylprolyl isomerase [Symmachiella dynata]|uniref:peptidylprolyl isomerase n=1 Tax=Symmachiella dynata TaxID=2527995 RepID=UPI0030EB8AEA